MRPKGFKNPYPDLTEEALTEKHLIQAMSEQKSNYEVFEAGADEYERCLFENCLIDDAITVKGHILTLLIPEE